MQIFYAVVIVTLLLCLFGGLIRVLSGPDNSNRMLAAQLFGTIGVTIMLVLAVIQENPFLANVALVLTLLASITVIAFLKLAEVSIEHLSQFEAELKSHKKNDAFLSDSSREQIHDR